jgi:NAD(P)-dependent dehydrogenase (short-subunit alcohol dehydrogenase family)
MNLSGKVAVVTGATGGVGSALVRKFAAAGTKVAAVDLDQDKLDALIAEIGASNAVGFALDVSDRVAYSALLDNVEERFGPLDFLCNVAAIMPVAPFDAEDPDLTDRVIDVNLRAVVHSTKDAARRMRPRGSGHIVNVASGAGWLAGGGVSTYCASKFGLVGYSESVAQELSGTGINISVVAPGVVKTDLSKGFAQVRGVRAVEPEEVADGILSVIHKPQFAKFVPAPLGVMSLMFSGMPYRVRDFLTRISGTRNIALKSDMAQRAEYERWVADGAHRERV